MEVFVLAGMVSVIVWTQVKSEIAREIREAFEGIAADPETPYWARKIAYMPTCEFCFSFWVTLVVTLVFSPVLYGSMILAHFCIWALANVYMTMYSICRVGLKCLRSFVEGNE